MPTTLKNLWFRDTQEEVIYINDTAMRIRAGILLLVPIYLSFTLYDAFYNSKFIVDTNTLNDTYETNFDDQIIYAAEVVKRVYEYSLQSILLLYVLFEMLAGMFVFTSRFSPLILLSTILARNASVVYKPLTPKRFAWAIGAIFISICLVFFNPDTVAEFTNNLFKSNILPTTYNYIPYYIPISLVFLCTAFMWLESIFGFCVGCKIHAALVAIGVLSDKCYACENIDWEVIKKRNKS